MTRERAKGRIALLALLPLLIAACAKIPPQSAAQGGVRNGRAEALERRLQELARNTGTLKALAWVEFSDGEEERRTEAALVLERPSSVRVDAMDALADVWAQAGSDGSRMWLLLPSRGKLYSGRASRSHLRRLVNFDWEMADAISLIAGTPFSSDRLSFRQVGDAAENHFLASEEGVHVWTDGRPGRPIKVARYAEGGEALEAMVILGEYRRVGGADFPHRVEATFLERGARIAITYREVHLGAPIENAVFSAPERGRRSTVELKD